MRVAVGLTLATTVLLPRTALSFIVCMLVPAASSRSGTPDLLDAAKDLALFVHDVLAHRVHDPRNAHAPLGGPRVQLPRGVDELLHDGHVGVVLHAPIA